LNRSRSINAQQVKAEQKCPLHMAGGGGRLKKEHCAGGCKASGFYGSCGHGGGQSWKTGSVCH
jgi:hypothetical protein